MTLATVMSGAWAIVLSMLDNSDDITFTHTSSGRQAPLRGIESVAGITTARVPVRVRIDKNQTITDYLERIQQQASETVEYEHFGVLNIAKILPEVAPAVLAPTSLLALQPVRQFVGSDETAQAAAAAAAAGEMEDVILQQAEDKFTSLEAVDGYHLAPLVTHCYLGDHEIDMYTNYNFKVLNKDQVEDMFNKIEHVLLELCKKPHESLGGVFYS
jgi:non-ribosomal peptide synthetase component F